MWKLYSEADKGVAIQTIFGNFTQSLVKVKEQIFAGIVQYIDYENDTYYEHSDHKFSMSNAYTAFIHKRNIYSHEKEFRAIFSIPKEDSEEVDPKNWTVA